MTEPPRLRLRLDKNQPGPLIPSALETYRALREDGGENGKRIKSVLERLRSDPGKVRGESLRYRPDGWIVLVEMADDQPGGSYGVRPPPTWSTFSGSACNQVLTLWPPLRKRSTPNGHAPHKSGRRRVLPESDVRES